MDEKGDKEANSPLGVLGSLMAGFEMLGRNWWLLALPALVDLFFWLGPQLSIAPLIRGVIAFLRSQPGPDAEAARRLVLTVQTLEQFSEQFNLFSLLSTMPLLSPPSLLAQHAPGVMSPMGERAVLSVTNVLALTGWGVVLVPGGLLLGFVYLYLMAERVHTLRSTEEAPASDSQEGGAESKRNILGCNVALKLVRVFLFSAGLLGAGIVLFPIWLAVLMIATEINEILLLLTWGLSMGMMSFALIHLLFVVHGVLLGERGLLRAILESVVLIRTNFPSCVGLVLAIVLIYYGLGHVWSLPPGDSWLLLIGILGNSCIATALITGTFVFYQERIQKLAGAIPPATT
ncbi:MAG: hypothetical protein JXA14_16875 [Anaerolineae bacterium]|nr:hypothetical protein [Anaerolineae bacterium]